MIGSIKILSYLTHLHHTYNDTSHLVYSLASPQNNLQERHNSVNCLAGIELCNVLAPPVFFKKRRVSDNFLVPVVDKIIKQAQLLHQICSK